MEDVRGQARKKRQYVRKEKEVERVPFGTVRLKMQMSDEDMKGFKKRKMVPYWFNDEDGRIERAKAATYSFVDPAHVMSLGQSAIHRGNSDEGSKVSMVVSRGTPVLRAYMMEISLRLWKKDQQAKSDRIDSMETVTKGDTGLLYGPGVHRV